MRVVGITGLAGSGKSTVARYLMEQHGYERGKFAGALKEMTRAFLRYRGVDEATIERMMDGDLKDLDSLHMNGKSPRYFMQRLGDEFGRQQIHQDIWVDTEMDARSGIPRVAFDDVRYPNEVGAIYKYGGIIVHITRPGLELADDVAAHGSESHAATLPYDLHLINDGSMGDLFRKIDHRIVLDRAAA